VFFVRRGGSSESGSAPLGSATREKGMKQRNNESLMGESIHPKSKGF